MRYAAATMHVPGRLEIAEFEQPRLEDGQVVVRTDWAGVCGSDVHVVHHGFHDPQLLGTPGYPGHEGAGVVVESRCATVPVGRRVLTVPPPTGGSGGCFAELQTLTRHALVPLPDEGDLGELMLAQQLGTALFALKRFVRRDDPPASAVVLGAGPVGLMFLQLLLRGGVPNVVVSEPQPQRRDCASRLGATAVNDPRGPSGPDALVALVNDAVPGGADLVIEATGTDVGRQTMADLVRRRGVLGVFGYPSRRGPAPFPVHRAFRKAVTVEFVSGTQSEPGLASFREAVDLIAARQVPLEHLRDHVFPLTAIDRAVRAAAGAEPVVKATLDVAAGDLA